MILQLGVWQICVDGFAHFNRTLIICFAFVVLQISNDLADFQSLRCCTKGLRCTTWLVVYWAILKQLQDDEHSRLLNLIFCETISWVITSKLRLFGGFGISRFSLFWGRSLASYSNFSTRKLLYKKKFPSQIDQNKFYFLSREVIKMFLYSAQ